MLSKMNARSAVDGGEETWGETVLACERATRSSLDAVGSFMGASESSSSSLRISTPAEVCFDVPPFGPCGPAPPGLNKSKYRKPSYLSKWLQSPDTPASK